MAIGLFMPLLKLVSRCAGHIIRRQRPPDPLQLELTHWLDLHGVLTLGLMRICPGLASSQRREATLETVPIAA